MRKSILVATSSLIAGAALMASLPAQAFFGPFGGWGGGPWSGWNDGWGGPWGGYPYYGYGYPYGGYGYPYGGYGYPYGGYGYPYGGLYGYPYAVPAVAAPAAKSE